MQALKAALVVLLVAAAPAIVLSQGCPNRCSGKGTCGSAGACTCFDGYTGADCGLRTCPDGLAWFDIASDTDTAHAMAECSNKGTCDRSTGKCSCQEPFVGEACEKMGCPSDCNGHGVCMSLEDAGTERDDVDLVRIVQYDSEWDADKIYGCACDDGYTGYDCSLRTCLTGDDPMTTGQVDEVKVLSCTCPSTCSGSLKLTFRGETTDAIAHDATATEVETALEALSTVRDVSLAFSSGSAVCGASEVNTTITFTHTPGDLPPLRLVNSLSSTGGTVSLSSLDTVTGTKEDKECSGRGICDRGSGLCACQTGFGGSDGQGGNGTRYDCGAESTTPLDCWNVCNGRGTCSGSPTFVCTCQDGFTGADCSQRTCPKGRVWFQEPTSGGSAHADWTECSSRGLCDRDTGTCTCQSGFEGEACQRSACPTDENSAVCGDGGRCMTMTEAAGTLTVNGVPTAVTYGSDPSSSSTWDADRIRGCVCDAAKHGFPQGNEGQSPGRSGFDCSLRTCPYGDDPNTAGVTEQQTLTCSATAGTFTLTFRGETTAAVAYDATLSTLDAALEALYTIGNVTVSGSGSTVCDGNAVTVQFDSDFGDLPIMTADSSALTSTTFTLAEGRAGTKEDVECSGNGVCATGTGLCKCARGFASSDGYASRGPRGDCGVADVHYTGSSA